MARTFDATKDVEVAFSLSKAQLFFCGGHGGLVTYDGKGGPMIKEGGPMDRLFLLRNDGRLVGDAGLDIIYGHINFRTGDLIGNVRVEQAQGNDTLVYFQFASNDDENAFEVIGGIYDLGVKRDTVLVHGTVAESTMVWETGDASKRDGMLPYVAFHPKVYVHPVLLEWFGFSKDVELRGAATAWCKPDVPTMDLQTNTSTGVAFRSQQHLGHLSVLL